MITVQLPAQMAGFAGGERTHVVTASNLAEVFTAFDAIAPMLRSQLFHSSGQLRQFVGLFVNDRQVLDADEMRNPIAPGGQVLIVQSVAGG